MLCELKHRLPATISQRRHATPTVLPPFCVQVSPGLHVLFGQAGVGAAAGGDLGQVRFSFWPYGCVCFPVKPVLGGEGRPAGVGQVHASPPWGGLRAWSTLCLEERHPVHATRLGRQERVGVRCACRACAAQPPCVLPALGPHDRCHDVLVLWWCSAATLAHPIPPPPPPPRPDASFVQPGTPLRFFAGAVAWGPGELEQQLEQGVWRCAGASRSLVLKHARQLEVPLWRELTDLMQQQPEGAQPAAT